MGGNPIKVSIVMPTYNRLEQLQQVLAGLEVQTFPLDSFEVIVISDGSTDGTESYLQSLDTPLNLRPVFQANQGAAAARNRGVDDAKGDTIIFIDDDVYPVPHFVAEHVASHAEYGDNVVILGPMLTPPNFTLAPWVRWEQAMLDKQYADMTAGKWKPTARQFYTGNASIARRHLLAAGGFDSRFLRAEDVELAYRLAEDGLGFVFNPQAVGYHHADRSFSSWMNTPYAYGRNDVVFAREKGQSWLLPTLVNEYGLRHPLVKLLTRLCLSRPMLSAIIVNGLKQLATMGQLLGIERLPQHAYSGIFNLRHYQGVADELGGRPHFFQLIVDAASTKRQHAYRAGESNA